MTLIVKRRIKFISLLVGGILIMLQGLFFFLLSDLYLCNKSTYLFITIILSFGSGVFFILSEKFKENTTRDRILFYGFKIFGMMLLIAFIVFMFLFCSWSDQEYLELAAANKNAEKTGIPLSGWDKFRYEVSQVYNGRVNPNCGKCKWIKDSLGNSAKFPYSVFHYIFISFSFVALATQIFNAIANIIFGIEE